MCCSQTVFGSMSRALAENAPNIRRVAFDSRNEGWQMGCHFTLSGFWRAPPLSRGNRW